VYLGARQSQCGVLGFVRTDLAGIQGAQDQAGEFYSVRRARLS
jgi:hypothetical protein